MTTISKLPISLPFLAFGGNSESPKPHLFGIASRVYDAIPLGNYDTNN